MKEVILKINKIFKADLVKVSFLSSISTIIKVAAGMVSTKVVAAVIGPSGIALIGQLNNFSTIVLNIATGGIANGVTKYVAENSGEEDKINKFIHTALWLTIVLSIFCGLVMAFGANYFSILILKSYEYAIVFLLFGITILFYALNMLLLAIVNGQKNFNLFIRINLINSVVGLSFSVMLSLWFGVIGAMVSVVSYQSLVFIITLFLLRNAIWLKWTLFKGRFDFKNLKLLSNYSLMVLVSAFIIPVSQLLVRSYLAKKVSVSDAGLWEGINRISGINLTIILPSFSVYYLPRLSELKTDHEIRDEIWYVYKLLIPFLIITSLGIFIFRHFIISTLYTNDFLPMEDLFAPQLIGDVIKMCGWILGYILVVKTMTKVYIIMEILNYTSFVIFTYIFTDHYGIKGATYAHICGHLIYLIGILVVFRQLLFENKRN
ncbi:MAG: O-antigen translocase [Chitinophagaceae bacterium]|nr:O-antigen translocase [Chitinophagaceae bacterium]